MDRPPSRQHRATPSPAARRHRARPVRQRRPRGVSVVAVAALFATTLLASLGALSGSGGEPAAAADSAALRTLVAQPGDTLWDIAAVHRGETSMIRYVDALVELNGGASIAAGQVITLP